MARRPTSRVLPFPVSDAQLSALPESPNEQLRRTNRENANPEIAILRMQHEIERMKRLGPLMHHTDVWCVQGYVFLLAGVMDDIEIHLAQAAELAAKATGLIA